MAEDGRGQAIRERALLSVSAVAAAIDTKPATVWRWENHRRRPTGPVALRWVRLLDALDDASGGDANV